MDKLEHIYLTCEECKAIRTIEALESLLPPDAKSRAGLEGAGVLPLTCGE